MEPTQTPRFLILPLALSDFIIAGRLKRARLPAGMHRIPVSRPLCKLSPKESEPSIRDFPIGRSNRSAIMLTIKMKTITSTP